jgi:gluconokinase
MFIIVFGVTGSGKTTIGTLLAKELGWQFYDADNFHPAANVEKMRQGIPLNDDDRIPWLAKLQALIRSYTDKGENAVLACSALRESYRQYLQAGGEVKFIYLKGDFVLIQQRLNNRRGHYMNPNLLQSQFNTLEEPRPEITVIDIAPTPALIVQAIRKELKI